MQNGYVQFATGDGGANPAVATFESMINEKLRRVQQHPLKVPGTDSSVGFK